MRSVLHKAFALLEIVAAALSLAVAAPARSLDTSNVLVLEDDGTRVPVVWRPLNDQDEQVPLYPSDVGSSVGK